MAERNYRIAAIGGDGIGPEVIAAGQEVLTALALEDGGFALSFTGYDWGSSYYRQHGLMMPADGLSQLSGYDAIYFGSAGDPSLPDDITMWGLRLAICQGFDQYANVRPVRLLPGVVSSLREDLAHEIDWAFVCENSEGEYAGIGGRLHRALPAELGMDVSVFTHAGVERIARSACELALSRPRQKLTVVTKSNAQPHGMVLWDEVCQEVLADYPGLDADFTLAGAMTQRMVMRPWSLDTILATNFQADILSNLAVSLVGGLGVGAAANLDPTRARPSMFEPIHGSAFDIAGKGVANPIGAFWSASLMLEHLGEFEAAQRLMRAMEAVTAAGEVLPPDLGGSASTHDVTQAIIASIRAPAS
jgi:tartrate dehydrogenase/decarboxylase / D-malate dehydrogenase